MRWRFGRFSFSDQANIKIYSAMEGVKKVPPPPSDAEATQSPEFTWFFLAQVILKVSQDIPVSPSDGNEYASLYLDHISRKGLDPVYGYDE
jgi:hypothetical protein